jgi:hypothetical protein
VPQFFRPLGSGAGFPAAEVLCDGGCVCRRVNALVQALVAHLLLNGEVVRLHRALRMPPR